MTQTDQAKFVSVCVSSWRKASCPKDSAKANFGSLILHHDIMMCSLSRDNKIIIDRLLGKRRSSVVLERAPLSEGYYSQSCVHAIKILIYQRWSVRSA